MIHQMHLEITRARPTDLETVLDFMGSYYDLEGKPFDRPASARTLTEFMSGTDYGMLGLIRSAGEAIGYFCLAFSYTLESHGKDCFLDELYIKASHRNAGIGTKVMQYIENYLADHGFKAMHLIVYESNPTAYRYYLKNGFYRHEASFMTKLIIPAAEN